MSTIHDLRNSVDLTFAEFEAKRKEREAEAKETKNDFSAFIKEYYEKARESYHKYAAEANEDDGDYLEAAKHRMQQAEHFVKAQ